LSSARISWAVIELVLSSLPQREDGVKWKWATNVAIMDELAVKILPPQLMTEPRGEDFSFQFSLVACWLWISFCVTDHFKTATPR
jgi:hypothetical protein